jgi:hypothetical protein
MPGGREARAMPEIGEADEEMEAARSNNVSGVETPAGSDPSRGAPAQVPVWQVESDLVEREPKSKRDSGPGNKQGAGAVADVEDGLD